jgi:DNA ligase-associated metallophosphoesterase
MVEVEWGGETMVALAGRALWWARRETLCVADVHLGKSAAFRSAGIPVPEGTTSADLARLSALVLACGAKRVVILGDLLHARSGRAAKTMEAFAAWRVRHAEVDVLLIRGNHDVSAGDPPDEWGMRVEDEGFADEGDGEVGFAHDPGGVEEQWGKSVLCGHVHPAVTMVGVRRGMRAPCFWFRERVCVLPAFGSFTGMKGVSPSVRDRVLAVGDDEVVEVSRGAKMRDRSFRIH